MEAVSTVITRGPSCFGSGSIGCATPRCRNLFETERELDDHIENAHHEVITRRGESYSEAVTRFLRANPRARECVRCYEAGKPWSKFPKVEIWRRGRKAQ